MYKAFREIIYYEVMWLYSLFRPGFLAISKKKKHYWKLSFQTMVYCAFNTDNIGIACNSGFLYSAHIRHSVSQGALTYSISCKVCGT